VTALLCGPGDVADFALPAGLGLAPSLASIRLGRDTGRGMRLRPDLEEEAEDKALDALSSRERLPTLPRLVRQL